MVSEMAGIPRKQAKVINLGMMYGMGVNKLSDQLDLSVEEAKALTKQYHNKVPFVKGLMRGVQNKLDDPRSSGSLRSLRGRKCRFDMWEPDSFAMHKALPREEAISVHGPTTRLRRAYTYKGSQSTHTGFGCGHDQAGDGKRLCRRERPNASGA